MISYFPKNAFFNNSWDATFRTDLSKTIMQITILKDKLFLSENQCYMKIFFWKKSNDDASLLRILWFITKIFLFWFKNRYCLNLMLLTWFKSSTYLRIEANFYLLAYNFNHKIVLVQSSKSHYFKHRLFQMNNLQYCNE